MRITAAQRTENENRIRAAMDRLLRGEIPPGGNCDIKTLAREAGVDRTAFYGTRPYAHLRAEFEDRLEEPSRRRRPPDPRDAQITRLKTEITALKERLARQTTISELDRLPHPGPARLAAQHDEITRLRRRTDETDQRPPSPPEWCTAGPGR